MAATGVAAMPSSSPRSHRRSSGNVTRHTSCQVRAHTCCMISLVPCVLMDLLYAMPCHRTVVSVECSDVYFTVRLTVRGVVTAPSLTEANVKIMTFSPLGIWFFDTQNTFHFIVKGLKNALFMSFSWLPIETMCLDGSSHCSLVLTLLSCQYIIYWIPGVKSVSEYILGKSSVTQVQGSLLFPKMDFFYKSSYSRFEFFINMQNWVFYKKR